MAFSSASTSNSLSGFTDPLSHSQYGNSSNFRLELRRRSQGEIARHKRTARKGRTQAPSTTNIRSALLEGSTPETVDQSHFDPKLGPIGSGRPRPRSASEEALVRATRDQMYSQGDMSNLRPDDPGMDIPTCLKLYGKSIESGEQEPPVTTAADPSERDASTTKKVHWDLEALLIAPSERQAETRTAARKESRGEAAHAIEMRDERSRGLRNDSEVARRTRENTFFNVSGI